MAWIIATKLEMTRVVKGDKLVPITLLQVPELRVVRWLWCYNRLSFKERKNSGIGWMKKYSK